VTPRDGPLSPAGIAKARAFAERSLTPAEYQALAGIPVTDEEREEIVSLIRWFRRRDPTATERLAYVRRAYARWTKAVGR
jgi:hypothetical protein